MGLYYILNPPRGDTNKNNSFRFKQDNLTYVKCKYSKLIFFKSTSHKTAIVFASVAA